MTLVIRIAHVLGVSILMNGNGTERDGGRSQPESGIFVGSRYIPEAAARQILQSGDQHAHMLERRNALRVHSNIHRLTVMVGATLGDQAYKGETELGGRWCTTEMDTVACHWTRPPST